MSDQGVNAKRRAYFGRKARLEKEAKQTAERAAARTQAEKDRLAEAAKAAERRNAEARKRQEQRRVERRREDTRRAFDRASDNKKAEQKRQAVQNQARAAFNPAAEDKKRIATRDQQQTRQKAMRERAEAFVIQREKQQKIDQHAEHNRQTDRLRSHHHAQIRSFKDNEHGAVRLHADKISSIDNAEQRDLQELGARRRSLSGRAVSLVKGSGHFDRQAQAIIDRHEADRWTKHSDLEALKERQFWAAQTVRVKQANERKSIADVHRVERRQLSDAHTKDRPRQIEARQQAFTRAAERARPKEKTQEQGRTLDLQR